MQLRDFHEITGKKRKMIKFIKNYPNYVINAFNIDVLFFDEFHIY